MGAVGFLMLAEIENSADVWMSYLPRELNFSTKTRTARPIIRFARAQGLQRHDLAVEGGVRDFVHFAASSDTDQPNHAVSSGDQILIGKVTTGIVAVCRGQRGFVEPLHRCSRLRKMPNNYER